MADTSYNTTILDDYCAGIAEDDAAGIATCMVYDVSYFFPFTLFLPGNVSIPSGVLVYIFWIGFRYSITNS